MARRAHIFFALCFAIAACSGDVDDTLNSNSVSELLDKQGSMTPSYTNYGNFIILPRTETGHTQRLFVFHDDNRKPSIFQLTETELPGLTSDMTAYRFSAKSNGRRVIAIYENGNLVRVGHLRKTDDIPISRPDIPPDVMNELALEIWLGRGNPKSKEILEFIQLFEASYPSEVRTKPLSSALSEFRHIKRAEPILSTPPRNLQFDTHYLIADWVAPETAHPEYEMILLLVNKATEALTFTLPETAQLRLHPLMSKASYKPARQSQITLSGIVMPGNSIALFVRPR